MNPLRVIGNLVLVLIIVSVLWSMFYYSSQEDINITVRNKERVNSSSSSKYLVFCVGEVFENEDSLTFLKFSSSDIYNELDKGQTYKVKVAGWRVPFFSMYRNIIKIYD